mmetsp:Transcript_58396/g.115769  ORF Transcript_58396/g.115769 Transcript_58396/m.115769 type:complete len:398 (-) Transcript_58396:18-1211(-)
MQEQLREMFHETELICSEADPGSVLEREATGLLGRLASRAGSRLSNVAASATSREDDRSTPRSFLSCSPEMHTNSALQFAPAMSSQQVPSPDVPELVQRPVTQREDRSKQLPPLPSREQPASLPARRPMRERAASRRGRSTSVEGLLSARTSCCIGADGMSECSTGYGSTRTDAKEQREQHAATSNSHGRSFSHEAEVVLPPLARRSELPPRAASMDRSLTTARLLERNIPPSEWQASQSGMHKRPAGASCADTFAHDAQQCPSSSSLTIPDGDHVLQMPWDHCQIENATSMTAAASRDTPMLVRIVSQKGSTTFDWESAANNALDCSRQNSIMSTASDTVQKGSVPLPALLQPDVVPSAAETRGSQALVRIVSQRGSTIIHGYGSTVLPEEMAMDS